MAGGEHAPNPVRLDDSGSRPAALAGVAGGLHLEALAAELIGALAERGVPAILLKGPVIARWLYRDDEVRSYGDVDVLVDPASIAEARREVLRLSEPDAVDLHESIPGIGLHPAKAFARLRGRTETLRIAGGVEVPVLDTTARTLHVALHAGWHGPAEPVPLRDLDLALELVPEPTWGAAADLARELAALEGFVTGLEQTERGRALRRRLGLPELQTVRARIGYDAAGVPAKRLAEVQMAYGWRAKAHVVRSILLPSRFDVKRRYPEARPGTLPLVRVHVRRIRRRLAELPAGVRSLWRER